MTPRDMAIGHFQSPRNKLNTKKQVSLWEGVLASEVRPCSISSERMAEPGGSTVRHRYMLLFLLLACVLASFCKSWVGPLDPQTPDPSL